MSPEFEIHLSPCHAREFKSEKVRSAFLERIEEASGLPWKGDFTEGRAFVARPTDSVLSSEEERLKNE